MKLVFPTKMFISAQYIPGIKNIYADLLLRKFSNSIEWMLNSEIFRICYQCFIPDIDVFAPRQNKQLHMNRFVSLNYDPEAYQVNAISVFWSKFCLYIFPTFKLIGIVIKKNVDDCVKLYIAFIKIPLWKTHAWFLLVRSAPVSVPIRLSQELIDHAAYRGGASTTKNKTSRLHCIRRSLQNSGLSKLVAEIIISYSRDETNKHYQCCWKRWVL